MNKSREDNNYILFLIKLVMWSFPVLIFILSLQSPGLLDEPAKIGALTRVIQTVLWTFGTLLGSMVFPSLLFIAVFFPILFITSKTVNLSSHQNEIALGLAFITFYYLLTIYIVIWNLYFRDAGGSPYPPYTFPF
jgi:hypothetical protein